MGARKIGPAIAAGCTMVLKPARADPAVQPGAGRMLVEAGLPAGVLNVITTSSAGRVIEPIIGDRRLRKLSFTGSTEVGRLLVAQSAGSLLRPSMELGGNAPFLVFEDADLDARRRAARCIAKMRNMGESCMAANRFFVARVGGRGVRGSGSPTRMAGMPVGRGTEPGVKVGPLIDDEAARQGGRAGRRRGAPRRQGAHRRRRARRRRATSSRRPC